MRYEPLSSHLSVRTGDRWTASFDDIEKILGFALPRSASRYPAWWANQTGHGHTQTKAWMDAGWRTRKLDLEKRRVEFERIDMGGSTSGDTDALFAQARALSGIEDHDVLVREAIGALVEREAARKLARAGSTMPNYEIAPRRRWSR